MDKTPDDLEREILDLLRSGRKLHAVKLFRDETGASLAEAKQVVEAYEASLNPHAASGSPATRSSGWEAEALTLLRDGQKLKAIKLCREQTRLSLMDSKKSVEDLARRHGIPEPSGCLGLILLAAVTISAVCVLVAI